MNALTLASTARKPRCEFCKRRIFDVDFERGNARSVFEMYDTLGGVCDREYYAHTYDCETAPRRIVEPK